MPVIRSSVALSAAGGAGGRFHWELWMVWLAGFGTNPFGWGSVGGIAVLGGCKLEMSFRSCLAVYHRMLVPRYDHHKVDN